MATAHAENSLHEHHDHVTPIPTLIVVFGALLIGMVLTIAANKMIPHDTGFWGTALGSVLSNAILFTIATVKAGLVVWFFMGVKHSSSLAKFFVFLGFGWFFMLFIMYCDYATRNWEPVPGWEPTQQTALPRQIMRSEVPHLNPEEVEKAAEKALGYE